MSDSKCHPDDLWDRLEKTLNTGLTVTKSVARTVAGYPGGPGLRSPAHPQRIPAICGRCAKPQDVMSGPPSSKVERALECSCCGHKWTCTVERGPLGGEGE